MLFDFKSSFRSQENQKIEHKLYRKMKLLKQATYIRSV